MSRSNPLAAILAGAGLPPSRRVRRAAPDSAKRVRAGVDDGPELPRCATPCLYEHGRCKFCGLPAAGRRARRRRGSSQPRLCAPESVVQRDCISLYVAIGCRYSAKHETDIYVLGTKRPRNLPKVGHKTFQTPGIADLFVFLPLNPPLAGPGVTPPRCVWHEVKAEDGGPSPAQVRFEQQCRDRGIAHVMGGVDAQTAFLERHGFLKPSSGVSR